MTGDLLAGAVGDIGIASDYRCASCFAYGAYDLTSQQETFFVALLKLATRDDPSIEDGSPAEQAQSAAALWQASTPPPTWRTIYPTEARAMGEIARRALPRAESTRCLLQAAGRSRLPGLHGLFDLGIAKRPGTNFPDAAAATETLEVLILAAISSLILFHSASSRARCSRVM